VIFASEERQSVAGYARIDGRNVINERVTRVSKTFPQKLHISLRWQVSHQAIFTPDIECIRVDHDVSVPAWGESAW